MSLIACLTLFLQAMAELLAENYHNIWATKKKMDLEAKGKYSTTHPHTAFPTPFSSSANCTNFVLLLLLDETKAGPGSQLRSKQSEPYPWKCGSPFLDFYSQNNDKENIKNGSKEPEFPLRLLLD